MTHIATSARVLAACTLIIGISLSTAHAVTHAHLFSQQYGGTSTDVGLAVATDATGNVYVTGYFSGTANFGGVDFTSAGGEDIFIAKYSPTGAYIKGFRLGSTGDDRGQGITIDGTGRVVVTGRFSGIVSFGSASLFSAGGTDIFLVVYDEDLSHQWDRSFGSAAGNDEGKGVVALGTNVLFVGNFFGTEDFGGGNLVSAGASDVVMAKYDTSGNHLWSRSYGSTGTDFGLAISMDLSANVVISGAFSGTVDFGGGPLVSNGATDAFVARYTTNGAHRWSRSAGGVLSDYGYGLAVERSSGYIVISGTFSGTANFGGSNLTSTGSQDVFLARYSNLGVHQWSKHFGSIDPDNSYDVAVDNAGQIALTGNHFGSIDLGLGTMPKSDGIFLARYDATGQALFASQMGSGLDVPWSVAFLHAGNVVLTGWFSGTNDFGGSPLTSAGAEDVFLTMFAGSQSEPVITAIDDIGNDQGRQVKVRFTASGLDQPAAVTPISHYEAYRRDDAPPAASLSWRELAGLSKRAILDLGWTQVGTVNAHGQAGYGMDVPTIGDSTVALGPYESVFFVRAATDDRFVFHDSPADSGYSLDNLAPGVPQNFVYAAGDLLWDESAAPDFDFFTVYGSNTDSFGSATVVDYSVANAMDVNASPYVFYFVTATDFSGNEGKPARVNTLSGVGGTPKSYVLSVSNYPNPFNPRTTVSYTVPSRGAVTVAVYDARGALVATLFNGERTAGAYSIEWDGRARNGAPVSTGVYFARVDHNGATRTKKMLLLK